MDRRRAADAHAGGIVKGRRMTAARRAAIAARFKVLSEPARLQVLEALREGPLHVSAVMEATGLNQANLSRHLSVLHADGLVSRRREGLFVVYTMADDGPRALRPGLRRRGVARETDGPGVPVE